MFGLECLENHVFGMYSNSNTPVVRFENYSNTQKIRRHAVLETTVFHGRLENFSFIDEYRFMRLSYKAVLMLNALKETEGNTKC